MNEVRAYHDPKAKPSPIYPAGFLSKLAKLIANLTYLQPSHVDQAFVSKENLKNLGLILMHTRIDDHNATMREWCLMIIRNAC